MKIRLKGTHYQEEVKSHNKCLETVKKICVLTKEPFFWRQKDLEIKSDQKTTAVKVPANFIHNCQ